MLSKAVKILCNVLLIISYIASIILFAMGFVYIVEYGEVLWIYFILAISIAVGSTITFGTIIAISNIDENISDIKDMMADDIQEQRKYRLYVINQLDRQQRPNASDEGKRQCSTPKKAEEPPRHIEKSYISPEILEQHSHTNSNPTPDFVECIEFLNKLYDLKIDPNDQYNNIVEQIMKISADTPSAGILKRKVALANDINDITRAIRIHKINNSIN